MCTVSMDMHFVLCECVNVYRCVWPLYALKHVMCNISMMHISGNNKNNHGMAFWIEPILTYTNTCARMQHPHTLSIYTVRDYQQNYNFDIQTPPFAIESSGVQLMNTFSHDDGHVLGCHFNCAVFFICVWVCVCLLSILCSSHLTAK